MEVTILGNQNHNGIIPCMTESKLDFTMPAMFLH